MSKGQNRETGPATIRPSERANFDTSNDRANGANGEASIAEDPVEIARKAFLAVPEADRRQLLFELAGEWLSASRPGSPMDSLGILAGHPLLDLLDEYAEEDKEVQPASSARAE